MRGVAAGQRQRCSMQKGRSRRLNQVPVLLAERPGAHRVRWLECTISDPVFTAQVTRPAVLSDARTCHHCSEWRCSRKKSQGVRGAPCESPSFDDVTLNLLLDKIGVAPRPWTTLQVPTFLSKLGCHTSVPAGAGRARSRCKARSKNLQQKVVWTQHKFGIVDAPFTSST